MKKKKSKTSKQQFERSQKAHSDLMWSWHSKPNSDKARAYGNYHADCIATQRDSGRILNKSERKKLFSYHWNYQVNEKHGKDNPYPSLKK